MIRSNQRFFNVLHIVSDGVLVFLSFILAYVIRFGILEPLPHSVPFYEYFFFSLIAAVVQIVIYGLFHLYSSQRRVRMRALFIRMVTCHGLAAAVLLMGLFLVKQIDFSRMTLAIFFLLETVILFGKRWVLFHILFHFRAKGYNQKHIFLLGGDALARQFLKEVEDMPELGYKLLGYLGEKKSDLSLEYLGNYSELEMLLEFFKPDEVVVAMNAEEYSCIGEIIALCEKTGSKMSIIPFYTEYFPSHPRVDFLNHIPMMHLRPIPLEHFGWAFLKRMIDFLGSLLLIILLSPLLLGTAVGVKLSSAGPVIFSQTRVGLNKKEFKMYKFRSMVVNTQSTTAWSQNKDPRKTKFGSFIRKCSIDELPQLFNVLKGDMSLVGPRPEIPHFVEQFKLDIPHYMVKHHVRPGITGWAQVNGFRGDTSIQGRIEHDLYYIEHWSLWFDIKILLLTLFKGIFNEEK